MRVVSECRFECGTQVYRLVMVKGESSFDCNCISPVPSGISGQPLVTLSDRHDVSIL